MRYEMQVWVSVSASSRREACKIVERQVELRDCGFRKSLVEYIDSEDLKAEPECDVCGKVNSVNEDWTTCAACQAEMDYDDAVADAKAVKS